MKSNNVKVFFKYEKDENKHRKVDGVIEAIAVNTETKEEIARRMVTPRHGDKPDKVLGRKYAFKKLMDFSLQNHLIENKTVEGLWKSFGQMCKQPSVKLAY